MSQQSQPLLTQDDIRTIKTFRDTTRDANGKTLANAYLHYVGFYQVEIHHMVKKYTRCEELSHSCVSCVRQFLTDEDDYVSKWGMEEKDAERIKAFVDALNGVLDAAKDLVERYRSPVALC